MDCVMIDRVSFEQMKEESEQFRTRVIELERENHLVKKLNGVLEQIKINLERLVQTVREQSDLDETPLDRELDIWQTEYTSVKTTLTQLGLLDTSDGVSDVHNSTEDADEVIITADHIWTADDTSAVDHQCLDDTSNDQCLRTSGGYLCVDDDLDNSVANSDGQELSAVETTPKPKSPTKRSKAIPIIEGQKRFTCTWSDCTYASDSRGNFQKHYRIHTGEKPYKCQYEGCAYSCSDPASLREHKLIHSAEKSYVCEWPGCSWRFNTHKLLRNHVRACHTGEKPHKCQWPGCDKSFLAPYALRTHQLKHTGDRPHKCDVVGCKASFARTTDLARHKRETHCTERQYLCEHENCGSKFYRKDDLKHHIKRKHDCPQFGRRLKRIKSLSESKDENKSLEKALRRKGSTKGTDSSLIDGADGVDEPKVVIDLKVAKVNQLRKSIQINFV